MARQLNRLSLGESIKIAEWLKARNGVLDERKLTFDKVADWAQSDLGFIVSPINLSRVAREAGVKWNHGTGSNNPVALAHNRITELESRVAALEVALK